jgi:hypothetical protein
MANRPPGVFEALSVKERGCAPNVRWVAGRGARFGRKGPFGDGWDSEKADEGTPSSPTELNSTYQIIMGTPGRDMYVSMECGPHVPAHVHEPIWEQAGSLALCALAGLLPIEQVGQALKWAMLATGSFRLPWEGSSDGFCPPHFRVCTCPKRKMLRNLSSRAYRTVGLQITRLVSAGQIGPRRMVSRVRWFQLPLARVAPRGAGGGASVAFAGGTLGLVPSFLAG